MLANAQTPLSESTTGSVLSYIYRLTDKEALEIYQRAIRQEPWGNEKYLHTLAGTYPRRASFPEGMAPGNYVVVYAQYDNLEYSFHPVQNVQLKMLNNNYDLALLVHEKDGTPITNAEVKAGKRNVHWDPNTHSYRLPRFRGNGIITVTSKGIMNIFSTEPPRFTSMSWWKRFLNKFKRKRQYREIPDYYRNTPSEAEHKGFMVFSKPKYKPNDTVSLKAFIYDKKNHPVNTPLLLRLISYNEDIDTILTTIAPYRPGGYEYRFVPGAGLNMKLDKDYQVTLETPDSKRFTSDNNDTDLSDREYLAQRKVFIRGTFTYEEYELKSIHFSARINHKSHTRGTPLALYLKATDENDLPIMDGRVSVNVTTGNVSRYHQSKVFIPEKLWEYNTTLDPVGETKVTIPDSIFPAASMHYHINATFLNSNNESQSESLSQFYDYNTDEIRFEKQTDSVAIRYLRSDSTISMPATLYLLNSGTDTVTTATIYLPAIVPLHPFASTYLVKANNLTNTWTPGNQQGVLQCNAAHTKDSIFMQVVNPSGIWFWYSIFAGNKLLEQGYSNKLSQAKAAITSGFYAISIQYIYNDKLVNEHFMVPYADKQLKVSINNPVAVFPGQTSRIGITVTDAENRPVEDADVTAWAITGKFPDYTLPAPPYLSSKHRVRKDYGVHLLNMKSPHASTVTMTWERWKNEMHLDSITYYQFVHAGNLYYSSAPAPDSITQISPFVTKDGTLQCISLLKIDEQPVYFDGTDLRKAYSFAVKPGKHRLELRMANQKIIVDNVFAANGMKTWISIPADKILPGIRTEKMPEKLTAAEINYWSQYMMLFIVNNDNGHTYISQGENVYWFNTSNYFDNLAYRSLAGPLRNMEATYTSLNNFSQHFTPEPHYTFTIGPGLVKEKEVNEIPGLMRKLVKNWMPGRIYDQLISAKNIDSSWRNYEDLLQINDHRYSDAAKDRDAYKPRLIIEPDTLASLLPVRQLFLYRYNDPGFVSIYPGATSTLYGLSPGYYRLLVLLQQKKYYVADSLQVTAGGATFYRLHANRVYNNDTIALSLHKAITDQLYQRERPMPSQFSNEFTIPFNNRYLDKSTLTRRIQGVVSSATGPIAGAVVVLNGTSLRVVTDAKGAFSLQVTESGSIRVSFVGYQTQVLALGSDDNFNIRLLPASSQLSDVVVTGYSTVMRRELTAAVGEKFTRAGLSGRAAGVVVRGVNSETTPPLLIIDGIPQTGNLNDLDPSLIASINILKTEAATALYGSRAYGGAIIVTRKKNTANTGEATPGEAYSLRTNFRDDAFWLPRLRTNENGEVSFDVTFPDDITNWKMHTIAATGQAQTGNASVQIRSYKPLSASLSLPQFAVAGDSLNVIGKVLNYGKDSVSIHRSFYQGTRLINERTVGVRNAHIDTFPVTIPSTDSAVFKYTIAGNDQYSDGESRAIPVFPQGVKETSGFFTALHGDTSFTLPAGKDTLHLFACTGMLPVLLEEAAWLQRYEYQCNEQMASKLIGLLLEKQARKYLGQPFSSSKTISVLIHRLQQNRSSDGGWGWWNKSNPVYWITYHVTQALLMAEKEGLTTVPDKQTLINYYVFQLNSASHKDKLSILETLQLLDARLNYASWLDTLHIPSGDDYNTYRLLLLKQRVGINVSTAALLTQQHTTAMGNPYWGKDSYDLFNNSVQLTLMAYRILRAKGGHDELLRRIRSWFMENRRSGNWRNTYESASILATILPDVLQTSEQQPPVLNINGQRINTFPYSASLPAGRPLQLSKQGGAGIYFTTWQQHWNPAPEKASHQFSVSSRFLQDNNEVSHLSAGKPVTLEIKAEVAASAEYVMIEVPIPAGCSYHNKEQGWASGEVHREHFRNKVSIFCGYLSKGIHTFSVQLMPRYTGYYHLNPAKAEMMYFPVFYGRTGIKNISITK